jgi:predicted nicotinamide N-methyase
LDAVELLRKNIEYLELENAEALQLDWNAIPENLQPDVILLSDVNYDPGQFDVLIHLIDEFMNQGCAIILSTPQRIMASPFVQKLEAYITDRYEALVDENGLNQEISILVLSK